MSFFHVCMSVFVRARVCGYVRVRVWVSVCVSVCGYVRVWVSVHVWVCVVCAAAARTQSRRAA